MPHQLNIFPFSGESAGSFYSQSPSDNRKTGDANVFPTIFCRYNDVSKLNAHSAVTGAVNESRHHHGFKIGLANHEKRSRHAGSLWYRVRNSSGFCSPHASAACGLCRCCR
uniref:Uncharacterized protein n=1 Tax=uncultured Vibrionales bacterium HF0010_22E23 TaxID=710999 RepID=E0XRI2_9GAMM|nr:hypothetical protein [uncultured Vibrionales bacterium HF0010_22E23]